MLDSGATANFIHNDIVTELASITTRPINRTIRKIDGSILVPSNECYAHEVNLSLPYCEEQKLEVIGSPIAYFDVVLEMPWFSTANPNID